MEKLVTPLQRMHKSPQQYHSLTLMRGQPKIRDFVNAMKQHLHKYHGRRVSFSYRWCRHEDGLYFALSGSRSVQDVFAAYLDNNNGDYYSSAIVTQYGRNTAKFTRAFDKLFAMKHGRSGRGEIK
ncbi:hypothetical protein [Pseudomonas alvandae]|uniref:hypothetical protein n=1 Tax=Pseudomonas canavaninivorans TaxID=2842348 RepID=UPI00215EF9CC|nr:hypothetical protein [Pseudomonas canavaninivorans]UVM74188.1 hypothetical protein LOY40_08550 [Pseudomonas canavaninivorans]